MVTPSRIGVSYGFLAIKNGDIAEQYENIINNMMLMLAD
jgi:hypothetical protein